jgi:hypothetical protein
MISIKEEIVNAKENPEAEIKSNAPKSCSNDAQNKNSPQKKVRDERMNWNREKRPKYQNQILFPLRM